MEFNGAFTDGFVEIHLRRWQGTDRKGLSLARLIMSNLRGFPLGLTRAFI